MSALDEAKAKMTSRYPESAKNMGYFYEKKCPSSFILGNRPVTSLNSLVHLSLLLDLNRSFQVSTRHNCCSSPVVADSSNPGKFPAVNCSEPSHEMVVELDFYFCDDYVARLYDLGLGRLCFG